MTNNLLKDKIQKDALNSWIKNDKKGTCNIITGLGKTFLGLHALYTMPRDNKLHIFAAEQVDRQNDLIKDILKYNEIFNVNVLKDYNLQFQCYQTICKWKNKEIGLVIADEIPDSLTPVYSQFYFNNEIESIIGLSATINKSIQYTDKNDKIFTKGDLLDKIAPICFKYTVNQGQIEGTSRKLNIYIINHELDPINKTVKAGSLKTSFFQTELNSYKYWDLQFKKSLFLSEDEPNRDLKILIASNKRRNLLYNLPSKIEVVKKLLSYIKGKSIVFGNSIDSLLQITKNTVSSRNTQELNNLIRENFDNNKIEVIGSFKKLQQGANLGLLDNVILHSYYGVEGKFIQMFGRARINNDKIGNVFILATNDTQEMMWLNKAIENFTEYNIIYCDNLEDCVKKYFENDST